MLDNSTNKNIGLVDRGLKLGVNTVLNTVPVSSFENGIALFGGFQWRWYGYYRLVAITSLYCDMLGVDYGL